MPIRPSTAMSERGFRPSTVTEPLDGRAKPHIIRSKVDLPAPLGPSRAVTPAPMLKLTSDTATKSPNHLDTRLACTKGGGAAWSWGSLIRRPQSADSSSGQTTRTQR